MISTEIGLELRVFVTLLGVALWWWIFINLRKRLIAVNIGLVLVLIGAFLIAFGITPGTFDAIAYLLRIEYPPAFYLMLAVFFLLLVISRLVLQVSLVHARCRSLCEEVSIMKTQLGLLPEGEPDSVRGVQKLQRKPLRRTRTGTRR